MSKLNYQQEVKKTEELKTINRNCIANGCPVLGTTVLVNDSRLCSFHTDQDARKWQSITNILLNETDRLKVLDLLLAISDYEWDKVRDDFCRRFAIAKSVMVTNKVLKSDDNEGIFFEEITDKKQNGDNWLISGWVYRSKYSIFREMRNPIEEKIKKIRINDHEGENVFKSNKEKVDKLKEQFEILANNVNRDQQVERYTF